MISYRRSFKRVITKEALKLSRIKKAKQDRSREFISCLACISAIGRQILLLLIYKGDLSDLQSTWVNKVETNLKAHFIASHNKQSNNAIGLKWLQNVFKQYTKLPRITQKQLLIIDKHLSHVNIAFVDQAN